MSLLNCRRRLDNIFQLSNITREIITIKKFYDICMYPSDPFFVFLIKYFEARDPLEALRFANCVASFVVEKEGIYGIPSQEDVLHRLRTRE